MENAVPVSFWEVRDSASLRPERSTDEKRVFDKNDKIITEWYI